MRLFKHLKWAALGVFALALLNCNDSESEQYQSTTIAALAVNSPDLTSLVTALEKTKLTSVLNGTDQYTVFAPTNAAFQQFLTANNFATLNDVPTDLLKQVLLNHVIAGKATAADLKTGYIKTLSNGGASATNTLSMYVDLTDGVKLNGVAKVTTANILASNGVIHKVGAVIPLPTVVTHAAANPNFSILVAALTRPDMPDFAGILSGTTNSPFTVFAPNNAAFASLLQEKGFANLQAIPKDVLEKTLKYHVVTGANVLAKDIVAGPVNTFLGQTWTIGVTNGVKITDKNARISNVIATDVQCTNGVIHVLDKVLLPTL